MKKILNKIVFVLLVILFVTSPANTGFGNSSYILGTTGYWPWAITIDNAGNIYTANLESDNVSKITPAGVSSILGTTGDGPWGITIDNAGNIYTANLESDNVSKITPAGVSSILGTTGDGPSAIAIDNAGNIYTVNTWSDDVSKITPAGVSSILGTTSDSAQAITIDSTGNIYTANRDSNNVSKITPAGVSSILGTTGDGPLAITVDNAGNIYTANNYSDNVSKITPAGVSSILGTTGDYPVAITIDNAGNIYTANAGPDSNNVSKIVAPFSDAVISSEVYTIIINGDEGTISKVPIGTSKINFLATITKGSETQTLDDTNISDLVQEGDTLLVTAEDGVTTITYLIDLISNDAGISSAVYTVSINGDEGTITGVPFKTSYWDFLDNLILKPGQQLGEGEGDADLSGIIRTGNYLKIFAEDGQTSITYTITVNNPPAPNFFWYKTGADANWNTLAGNWWQDENHTIPAPGLPGTEDVVKTLGMITPLANTTIWQVPSYIDATNTGVNISSPGATYPSFYTNILGDVTLHGSITIQSEITGNVILYDSTIIGGDGVVRGDAVFYDNSYLYPNGEVTGNAVFYNSSKNRSTKTVQGDAVFNDSSTNDGSVLGNAIFYGMSINNDTVEGSACFRDESINSGEVGGEFCPIIVSTSSPLAAELSAMLNAEITKTGNEEIGDISERGFEYGTTTNYGAEVSEVGEYSTGVYSLEATRLSCETTYHVRAYATSTFGTSYGEDSTFETSSCQRSSSGSRPEPKTVIAPAINLITTTGTVCPQGHKFSVVTGLPCTTFTDFPVLNTSGICPITMTLKESYRGPQVKCLQSKLSLNEDGIFGPVTKAAVVLFQKNHNLIPDGIVGPLTREKINK